jgi:hypothetical protein
MLTLNFVVLTVVLSSLYHIHFLFVRALIGCGVKNWVSIQGALPNNALYHARSFSDLQVRFLKVKDRVKY